MFFCLYKYASNFVIKTVARVLNASLEPTISTYITHKTEISS